MKRILLSLLLCLAALSAFCQEDTLTRARSRYAVNNFSDDDKYTAVQTYETVSVSQPKGRKVRNIILMIGDGMGLEQAACGWVVNGGKLNIDNFPYVGIQRTYARNSLVTDSSAAGSAIATGHKTNYDHISADPDGTPNESVMEYAASKGKKTGIAVTCRINDATPAAFCTHITNRDLEEDVISQMAESKVDFLIGGGLRYWNSRSDGRDIVEEMKEKGYTYVDTEEQLKAVGSLPVLGLFADLEMKPSLERGDILEQSAIKALELLDCRKGFFLMIEGSSIDDWCHRQKVGYAMEELFDFDRTVGHVLKWAEKDGETLVIVTGDHCTGGLSILDGSIEENSVKVNFSTGGHNGIALPVYAYGPHAEDFTGIYENTELSDRIKSLIR